MGLTKTWSKLVENQIKVGVHVGFGFNISQVLIKPNPIKLIKPSLSQTQIISNQIKFDLI